jgi:ceramide glucosyltransferase
LAKDEIPHITIIRPIKGWEDGWYDCLASTFRQTYPREMMTICLCVASTDDPSYPFLVQLLKDFPEFDAHVLVEEQDPVLHGEAGHAENLGPNPKVRNMSRAYREAKGDAIWIIDANVWVSSGVAGRMVDKLFGFLPNRERQRPFKFVHQLPLVIDISLDEAEAQSLLSSDASPRSGKNSAARSPSDVMDPRKFLAYGGGLLDEMFMSTTHAKFYSAINTVGIAPCIVGKSNMFRKSHLDRCTDPATNPILPPSAASRGRGIDFFSSYICEDHLIGDLLWRSNLPGYANHGLVFGDLAIQPTADMSVADYVARRVRWLRVRKWTVLLATLVEPGVESLLCSAYFSFAVTTWPWFHHTLGIPQTWVAALVAWLSAVTVWMLVDRCVCCKLRNCESVEFDDHTPHFARGTNRRGGVKPRPFVPWLCAWLGREVLALPIWTWAVLLGTTVTWRGKSFKVRMDMRVVEIPTRNVR